eukprot:scaffold34702_cov147-Amphora_coffeaeformis.AAC.3
MELYGGSVLAMAGRDAIVVVTDQRFGRGLGLIQAGYERPVWNAYLSSSCSTTTTTTTNHRPTTAPHACPWLLTATGLPSDVQSLQADVQAILQRQDAPIPILVTSTGNNNDNDINQHQTIMGTTAATSLVSHLLYTQRRYLVEPLLVGFIPKHKNENDDDDDDDDDDDYQPYLCTMDTLGATSVTSDYAAVGSAAVGLWGAAAAQYPPHPRCDTPTLVRAATTAFFAAVDRDITAGYGAVVHVLHARTNRWESWTVTHRND